MPSEPTPGAESVAAEERRIRAQFRAEKKRIDYSNDGLPTLYLRLARQWKRPVQEIKRIVKAEHIDGTKPELH